MKELQISDYFVNCDSSFISQLRVYGIVQVRHISVIEYVYANSKPSVEESWRKSNRRLTVAEYEDLVALYPVTIIDLKEYFKCAEKLKILTEKLGLDKLNDKVNTWLDENNMDA